MSINIEDYIQLGIGGLALYLMYKIMTGDLQSIKTKLDKVIEILEAIKKSVEPN